MEASQITKAAIVSETPEAAQVAKDAVEISLEASQIVGAAKVAETLGTAKVADTPVTSEVAARITVEAANEPAVNVETVVERLLTDIFEVEEAAQINPDLEQLNDICKVEEAVR